MFNASGRAYPRWANHFDPYSPIYSQRERMEILASDLGLVAVILGLHQLRLAFGFGWLVKTYLVPYFIVNFWLVMITYLQHTHPSLPHYDEKVRACGSILGVGGSGPRGLRAAGAWHACARCLSAVRPTHLVPPPAGMGLAARRARHRGPLLRHPGPRVPPHRRHARVPSPVQPDAPLPRAGGPPPGAPARAHGRRLRPSARKMVAAGTVPCGGVRRASTRACARARAPRRLRCRRRRRP